MISFEPLYNLLESKDITIGRLSIMLGLENGALTQYLKKGTSMDIVVKICSTLHCDISDVICYKSIQKEDFIPKRTKAGNGIKVNWDKIPGPLYETSAVIGRASNYLTQRKSRDSGLPEEVIDKICNLFNVSREDLCVK